MRDSAWDTCLKLRDFTDCMAKCDLLLGPRKLVEPSLSFNNNYHQARN